MYLVYLVAYLCDRVQWTMSPEASGVRRGALRSWPTRQAWVLEATDPQFVVGTGARCNHKTQYSALVLARSSMLDCSALGNQKLFDITCPPGDQHNQSCQYWDMTWHCWPQGGE
jgi:hypothetical protein